MIWLGFAQCTTQVLHYWSILPAYTIDGYLENILVKQGSVDFELFSNWLCDHFLPQCTLYLGPRFILTMDNCSTH